MKRTLIAIAALAALLIGTAPAPAQKPDPAHAALKAAMDKELLDGDLKRAIDLYAKVANTHRANKSIAAQALLRLGQCQEKLGQSQAASAYERLLSQYADQKEAATARTRLAALRGSPSTGSVQARLVWDNAIDDWGSASADGRYLSFVHWPTLGIAIRDLSTGTNHVIPDSTLFGRNKGEAGGNAISPDGKRVAFAYNRHNQPQGQRGYTELHVLNADGSGHKLLLPATGIHYIEPQSWSPDGKWIAAVIGVKSDSHLRLALVPSNGGQPRYLPIPTKQTIAEAFFSPDGKWLAYSASTIRGAGWHLYLCSPGATSDTEIKLAENAVTMGWAPNSSAVLFRRERAGQHDLYLQPIAGGKPSGESRIIHTNTDVGTSPQGITTSGTLLYGIGNRRAEATLFPFTGDLAKLGSPILTFPVAGSASLHLGGGTMRFSPDGKRLLAISPSGKELIIRTLGEGIVQSITPRIERFFRAEWSPDGNAIFLQGLTETGRQGIHRLDLATSKITVIAPVPEDGWNFVPSPDGRTIYYGGPSRVLARDIATGQDKEIWTGDGDGYFQLLITRNGQTLIIRCSNLLVAVTLASGQARTLFTRQGQEHGVPWASALTHDDTKVLAILRAGSMSGMQFGVYPIDGSAPSRFPAPGAFRGLHVSPDGKLLGTTVLARRNQIWALENFLPTN